MLPEESANRHEPVGSGAAVTVLTAATVLAAIFGLTAGVPLALSFDFRARFGFELFFFFGIRVYDLQLFGFGT
jgi:hypothetical protein